MPKKGLYTAIPGTIYRENDEWKSTRRGISGNISLIQRKGFYHEKQTTIEFTKPKKSYLLI